MTCPTVHRSPRPEYSRFGQGKKGSMRLLIKMVPIGIALLLASTLFVSGCSRKSGEMGNSQANAQTNQVVETAPPVGAPVPPAQSAPETTSIVQADGQANMAELDRVARTWMLRNHRRPTSWEDFAANAGVQIPPPPPGKKYVVSRDMRVTLMDR
jgi:hypothetical protein